MTSRRKFIGALAMGVSAGAAGGVFVLRRSRWDRDAYVKPDRSEVAVIRAEAYDDRLDEVVRRGIALCRLDVRGRRVVLKPNMVEFDPRGAINTNPALIAAAARVFRSLDARDVVVAEGPGHRRDNDYLIDASGLRRTLADVNARYIDLNTDGVRRISARSRFTGLTDLWLPDTILDADLVVSMPKLKTHHWAGVTLSMKNFFGIMPSMVYGWPKNLLHQRGIENSIVDINASLPVPRFAIVDGIVGMEGNGPIQGTAKRSGFLAFGADFVAVDATCARLMTIEPSRVEYLETAAEFLGNVAQERIDMLGEPVEALRQDYQVLDRFRNLKPSA
jgi:uncharacterized protein (DUF362 family)